MTYALLDSETQAFLFDTARLRRFNDGLNSGDHKTIRQEAIWAVFAEIYRDLPSGPERRRWLMAVLEKLAEKGEIVLPVEHGSQWDRTSAIQLPTAISLARPEADQDARMPWREFPWHPRLQWMFQLRTLAADQFEFLKRVHDGLVEGWFEQFECFKYRSLQLTGDEKRLESLHKGMLFAPGRLTLEMLGCESEALPLATEHFSSQPTLLIFENAAPFMLARKTLAKTAQPRIGRVAYGAGKQVLKAVPYFEMIQPALTEILYVGDLDAEGMMIAADLQRLSKSIPVLPATEFHHAMLASAAQLGAADGWAAKGEPPLDVANTVIAFLAPEVGLTVATLIAAGRRIPEEVLSHSAMCGLLNG